ncbi:Lipase [Porphyridium purpureum]|uniref:Lipase n=1 Tax=Porphyridium purpureum TaxID=35688 RepID=A0A5J4YQB8_PORPP|nr:Lipase [Porphyridium purpureum]|eukprot:POR7180..scf296_7
MADTASESAESVGDDVAAIMFEDLAEYVDERRIEKFGAVDKAPPLGQVVGVDENADLQGKQPPIVFKYDATTGKDAQALAKETGKKASGFLTTLKSAASRLSEISSDDQDSDYDAGELDELQKELAARELEDEDDVSLASKQGLVHKFRELSTKASSRSTTEKKSARLSFKKPATSEVGTTMAADEAEDPVDLLPRQCMLAPPAYTRREAEMSVEFTSAAYCKVHNGSKFECGCPTPAAGFTFTGRYVASKTDSSGFVGRHPKLAYICAGFRGTVSLKNWSNNLKATPIIANKQKSEVGSYYKDLPDDVRLHLGFYRSFEGIGGDMVKEALRLHRENPGDRVYVTGHSLGGAMATHMVLTLALAGVPTEQLVCYTFGQPRVGNEAFRREFDARVKDMFRIVNNYDVVPHLPAYATGFRHVGHELWFSSKLTAAQRKALLVKNQYEGTEGDRAEITGLMDACANTIPMNRLGIVDHLLYYDRITGTHRLRGASLPKNPVKQDGRVEVVSDNFYSSVLSRTDNILVWEYSMRGKNAKTKAPFQQLLEYAKTLAVERGIEWNLRVIQINTAVNDLPRQYAPVPGQASTVYFKPPSTWPPPPPILLDGPITFDSLKALVEAYWSRPVKAVGSVTCGEN